MVLSQAETRTETPQREYLLSPDDLAGFLGVSRSYAYMLFASGAFPVVRIGRLRKVRRSDVDKFLDASLERGEVAQVG